MRKAITRIADSAKAAVRIMKTQRRFREKMMFALSVSLFLVLTLIPGLVGSYAYADCGGGGGGDSGCKTCEGGYDYQTFEAMHHDWLNPLGNTHIGGSFHRTDVYLSCAAAGHTSYQT